MDTEGNGEAVHEMNKDYRGFVYLGTASEYPAWKHKVDDFHEHCELIGLDPDSDEAWESYNEARQDD